MVTRAYFARRFLALKLLRAALVAGAFYDAWLALLFLWRPGSVATVLALGGEVPPPMAALAAVWLALLATLGVAAARDFRRYSVIIATLICGRAVIAILLTIGAVATSSPLPWAAAWNALVAVILAAAWWPQRG